MVWQRFLRLGDLEEFSTGVGFDACRSGTYNACIVVETSYEIE